MFGLGSFVSFTSFTSISNNGDGYNVTSSFSGTFGPDGQQQYINNGNNTANNLNSVNMAEIMGEIGNAVNSVFSNPAIQNIAQKCYDALVQPEAGRQNYIQNQNANNQNNYISGQNSGYQNNYLRNPDNNANYQNNYLRNQNPSGNYQSNYLGNQYQNSNYQNTSSQNNYSNNQSSYYQSNNSNLNYLNTSNNSLPGDASAFVKMYKEKEIYVLKINMKGIDLRELSIRYDPGIIDINLKRSEYDQNIYNNYGQQGTFVKRNYNKKFTGIEEIDLKSVKKSIDNGIFIMQMPIKYAVTSSAKIIDVDYYSETDKK